MSIYVDRDSRVIVQGVTGEQGRIHTKSMLDYGTDIVAGVTPGKGGIKVHTVPVYNTVQKAKEDTEANTSIIFVPAPFAKDASLESIEAGMELVVIITEGIPVQDSAVIMHVAEAYGTTIIGPNAPGIITPGVTKLGIMPHHIFKPGTIGLVSRSGTLTYEIVNAIVRDGYGQSTSLGLGGDPIVGLDFIEVLQAFAEDDDTEAVVLIGEIGGSAEENAAAYIAENMDKPVVAYIAGRTAPEGKRMGHAGAIVSRGGTGTATAKIAALEQAGVPVAKMPSELGSLLDQEL